MSQREGPLGHTEHLSVEEFQQYAATSSQAGEGQTREAQALREHLSTCAACADFARASNIRANRPQMDGNSGLRSQSCPSGPELYELAGGLVTEEKAQKIMQHVSQCDDCSNVLLQAVDDLRMEEKGAAGTSVEGLRSASPEWQASVAAKMAAISVGPANAASSVRLLNMPRRHWLGTPVLGALAAGLILMAALLGLGWRAYRNQDDTHLLAAAYNKQRLTPLRVPGSEPVPMASEMRSASRTLREPTELSKLRLRAHEHLDETPSSPYWHQVLGRIDLLTNDGVAARRNLEIAQATDDTLPGLQADLAGAWFEIGESSGDASAYAQAAELYSQALDAHPENAALLHYNRAICWERQGLNENAVKDLRAALDTEHSDAWRKSIVAEIARLSAHAAISSSDGYEEALDVAKQLLPAWGDSADARTKIRAAAALGMEHQDRWLEDCISGAHTQAGKEADRYLASAVLLDKTGHPDQALANAQSATTIYARFHNRPGVLLAGEETVFALQRLGRGKPCLGSAAKLLRDPQLRNYALMRAQLLLNRGSCAARSGGLSASLEDYVQAASISSVADLPAANLKAIQSQAEALRYLGMVSEAWNQDITGLVFCEKYACSAGLHYGLLYNMVVISRELGREHVALDIMQTAVEFAKMAPNKMSYAYALEILATLQGIGGDYAASEKGFLKAYALTNDGESVGKGLYYAAWQSDEAGVLLRRGNAQASMERFQQSAPNLLASDYGPGRIDYYSQSARTQLALRHTDAAIGYGREAIREAERTLSTVDTVPKREQWAREHKSIYAELADIYQHASDEDSALAAWERFRSLPYDERFAGPAKTDSSIPFKMSVLVIPVSTMHILDGLVALSRCMCGTQ